MRLPFALLVALALALAACGEVGSADLDRPPPAPEERLADWERQPEGTAVPVTLGFEHPLPDSTIAALLTRHSVRPYAVYLVAAGMGSSLRRDRIRASLEVLGEAREQAMSQLHTSLCAQPGRTRAMLKRPSGTEGLERERQMLSQMAALQRSVPKLEMGAPVIYGVEAVGSITDVRALRDEPAVVSWEPGWRGQIRGTDTVVVPQPPAVTEIEPPVDSAVMALSPDEVRSRLVELTTTGVGSCEDAAPADEPR